MTATQNFSATSDRLDKLIPHNYLGIQVFQSMEDTVIGGKEIPAGYVNATQMCVANKKRLDHYFENKKTKTFLEACSRISGERLIIVIQGGNEKDIQGTWVHPNVANNLAQWINPEFAAWASEVLTRSLRGEYKALTDDAQKALEELQDLYAQLRGKGKFVRRVETDAIAHYIATNEVTVNYKHWIYDNCTNCVYRGLFEMTAADIREELVLTSDAELTRDHLTTEALDRIREVESLAARIIMKNNTEPLEAHKEALKRLDYDVIDPINKI